MRGIVYELLKVICSVHKLPDHARSEFQTKRLKWCARIRNIPYLIFFFSPIIVRLPKGFKPLVRIGCYEFRRNVIPLITRVNGKKSVFRGRKKK